MHPRLQAAIDRAFALGEVGLQVAAYRGTELIVDVSAGVADEETGAPVRPDTLFPVFSVTKAVTATAVHLQAERGFLDIDAPIVTYWPEYGAHGKGAITTRHVMTHRAGVPAMPNDVTPQRLLDWDWIIARLADMKPLCPPGERSIYHAMTFGYLLAEVVRRTDPQHRGFGEFVREEICSPLHIEDLWIGIPAAHDSRIARLTYGRNPMKSKWKPNAVRIASLPPAIDVTPGIYNLPELHRCCLPAASGIMNARAGAKFFSLLANGGKVDGVRLLSGERLLELTRLRENPTQIDEAVGSAVPVGIGGYYAGSNDPIAGPGPHVLWHPGAGGSIGWADLDSQLAVTIAHNRMFPHGEISREQHPFIEIAAAIRDIAAKIPLHT